MVGTPRIKEMLQKAVVSSWTYTPESGSLKRGCIRAWNVHPRLKECPIGPYRTNLTGKLGRIGQIKTERERSKMKIFPALALFHAISRYFTCPPPNQTHQPFLPKINIPFFRPGSGFYLVLEPLFFLFLLLFSLYLSFSRLFSATFFPPFSILFFFFSSFFFFFLFLLLFPFDFPYFMGLSGFSSFSFSQFMSQPR